MTLPPRDSLECLTHADLIGVVRDLIGEATRMRAENEKLGGALAKLRVEHRAVKDELVRLKALPPRPKIKPSKDQAFRHG
jgi:regulator of replication initiation timing